MRLGCFFVAAMFLASSAAESEAGSPQQALDNLDRAVPRKASDLAEVSISQVAAAATSLEEACLDDGDVFDKPPEEILAVVRRLLVIKQELEGLTDAGFSLRTSFVDIEPERQRAAARNYLRVMGILIDVSGRLRYLLNDEISTAAEALAALERERQQLVDILIELHSASGASVMADLLSDPPADSQAAKPSTALRARVLELIAVTGQCDLLPQVAGLLRAPDVAPSLKVLAAEVVRRIGLPQDERPGQDAQLPRPPITATELHSILSKLAIPDDHKALRRRRAQQLDWLAIRKRFGVTEGEYRLGTHAVRPGDWLLMRNPSPYNLFTDLSPGLFTHVGVVALEKGSDGIQRMVIVDLPERGRMPATNIDAFLKRTRHYAFVRYRHPKSARDMGDVAASIIGNETQFDLTFRTDRVSAVERGPLSGKKIHTYCAGLLLLCARQAGIPRRKLFPISEYAAGGKTSENLAGLGMSIGDDFVSPSGALFSSELELVGRREPTYDPQREIEEAIYDYFAVSLIDRTLNPSADLYHTLRLKLAEASRENPLLARALTTAVGVSAEMDLLAAAKAQTVIEILDGVAYGSSAEFLTASRALRAGPLAYQQSSARTPQEAAALGTMRKRHARLLALWQQDQISPRQLRVELVKYYIARGKERIDRRFFRGSSASDVTQ